MSWVGFLPGACKRAEALSASCTMRFESTAEALAERMLTYYKIR